MGKWLKPLCVQVQSGGAFDVDYEAVGPNERTIMKGEKERQGDFVFTANDVGEYRFCFNNEMSTFAEKVVDFEIAVRNSLFSTQHPLMSSPSSICFPLLPLCSTVDKLN